MPRQPTVVLIHGILSSEKALAPLRRFLESQAYTVLAANYPSRRISAKQAADQVYHHITRTLGANEPFHAIGHSLGGIVLRLIAHHQPELLAQHRILHSVMLGTPNRGSELSGLLAQNRIGRRLLGPAGYELSPNSALLSEKLGPIAFSAGVIAGNRSINPLSNIIFSGQPNDGAVKVSATKVAGMSDWIELSTHHSGLHFHPESLRQIIFFIKHGRFDRTP